MATAWNEGAPPKTVDVAWLRIEEPDGDGGATVEVKLGCFDGGNSLRPNDPDAWKGTGSMLMFRVGKSRSGRELDRQLHDGFMPAVETRERIPTCPQHCPST